MEDPHFWPLTAHMPNLVIVRLAGARPRIGEIVTPGVYFLPFFFLLFDVLAHLHRSHRSSYKRR